MVEQTGIKLHAPKERARELDLVGLVVVDEARRRLTEAWGLGREEGREGGG